MKQVNDNIVVYFHEKVIEISLDRMLDMGFRSTIDKLLTHPTMNTNPRPQCLMFSATFPDEIQHLAGQYLNV